MTIFYWRSRTENTFVLIVDGSLSQKERQRKSAMPNIYRITIPGRPVPKGRPRFGKSGQVYTPKKTKEYEQLVGWIAKKQILSPLDGDIALHIKVYVKNNVYPDIDNIAKSIMDGLNKIAFKDDKQVSYLTVQRIRGPEEKTIVELEEI